MATQVVKCLARNKFDYSSDPLNSMFPTDDESTLPASLTRVPQDFTITTDSYMSLCSRSYAASLSTGFWGSYENIPESAFQYYAVILLWKRIAQILPSSVKSGSEFFSEIAKVESYYYLPAPLHKYLQGIGYFHDPDGCNRRFVLPVIPTSKNIADVLYTFGKVDAKTHSFYEALPSPGIAALRIQADIRYTEDPSEQNLWWDLPEEICPDIQGTKIESVKPTENLLGWAPAKRLTANQQNFFKSLEIGADFMPDTFSYPNCVYMMLDKIAKHFARPSRSEACLPFSSLHLNGSIVQGMAIKKHHEPFKFDRSVMYCEGNLSVCLPYKSTDSLNRSAVISGYRMAREPTGDRHSWSCYDFDEYQHVPQSWIHSRNSVHTFGTVGRLNETVYATAYTSKRVLQNECIQRTFFGSSESLVDYP